MSTRTPGLCSLLSLCLRLVLVASSLQASPPRITQLLGVPAASATASTERLSGVDVTGTSVTSTRYKPVAGGTATVDQVPVVLEGTEPDDRRGSSADLVRRIGVVGEREAGLEEVVSLISNAGGELSWVYDTNIGSSRVDPSCAGWEVECQLRLRLEALLADHDTGVVVVVMRPVNLVVARRIADAASDTTKPIIFVFQGVDADIRLLNRGNSKLFWAQTLDNAALHAVALATTDSP